ncbi:hypothetical protein Hanom_Chr15g01414081 [Helianthus anomalus]
MAAGITRRGDDRAMLQPFTTLSKYFGLTANRLLSSISENHRYFHLQMATELKCVIR